jgi:Rod binding domain-containing protein
MNFSIASAPARLAAAPPAVPGKAQKAAQEFEAVLLGSMLESLQKTFAGTAQADSPGSDNYAALSTQALASTLSAQGGIGIATMILRHWGQTKVPGVNTPEVLPPS